MGYVIALAVIAVLVVLACCRVSGDCARVEEQAHPCENCNRWEECNGVDEECPWKPPQKPTRCVDPVIKFCQECKWGWVHYPEWVENSEDLAWCRVESGCTLGYDQGRPEDEPTEEELQEYEKWCREVENG